MLLLFFSFIYLETSVAVLNEIDKKLRPNTKAVISTHASNICPRQLPISKIGALCRRRKVFYIVDAAQSAGIYDISIMRDGISILCAPGHKGLYGPQGTGILLCGRIPSVFLAGETGSESMTWVIIAAVAAIAVIVGCLVVPKMKKK